MNEAEEKSRFNLLMYSMGSDLSLADQLVSEDPTIVSAKNGIGETALHYIAVENGIVEVRWLLDHGADINTRNDFGQTPLMEAASLDYYKLCKFLLENGADILAKDHNEETAISSTATNSPSDSGDTATLELLLAHAKHLDINQFFSDLDVSMILESGHPDVIKLLVERGLRANPYPDDSE